MRIIAKMHLAFNRALRAVNNKKGQSLVEYLFMLGIIVAVVMIVGALIKGFMPDLFDSIKEKILGQANGI